MKGRDRLADALRQLHADCGSVEKSNLHAGDQTLPLTPQIRAVAFSRMLDGISPLK